jgi:integrase
MRKKLTQLTVDSLGPPKRGRLEVWDTELPSFGLRITANGARSYFLMTRIGQGKARRLRRYTVGSAAVLTKVADARAKARDILRRIDEGQDPGRSRDAPPDLFRAFVLDYLARRKPNLRPSSYAEYERLVLQNAVPRWGDLRVGDIKQKAVADLLDDMVERDAAVSANRLLSVLKKLFKDAVRRELITTSPAAQLEPLTRERSRERALSDDELGWFWTATEQMAWPYGYLYRLAALTGQRRDQLRLMAWTELDLNNRTWTIPGTRMKGSREHVVALSDLASEALADIKRIARTLGPPQDGLVFSIAGRPLTGFPKAKGKLDRLMKQAAGKAIAPWRLHDLRRTLVHGLAQLGFAPHIADRVLAHSQGTIHGVAAVYNQYEYLDERRDALAAWGRKIEEIIGRRPSNVTVLAAKR